MAASLLSTVPSARAQTSGAWLDPAERLPPEPPSTAHRHDGFYLRVMVGPSYVRSYWKDEKSYLEQPQDAEVSGAGVDLSLLMGGSPIPGLAIGAGLNLGVLPSPSVDAGHVRLTPTSQRTVLVGIFADGFLAADSGWHAGGMLGVGSYGICCPNTADHEHASSSSSGFGGALWAGYDAWVSDQWSVGALMNVSGLSTHGEAFGPTWSTTKTVSGLLTILYH